MAEEVKLPRLGQGMESGTIVKWLKSEGDRVEKGEPLYEVDTDKATQEVEAEASGVLLAIAIASGEVPVGQTVAVIGEPGEAAAVSAVPAGTAQKDAVPAETALEKEPGPAETAVTAASSTSPSVRERSDSAVLRTAVNGAREQIGGRAGDDVVDAAGSGRGEPAGSRLKASPLARRIARERGIELGGLTGTGPEGRIVAEDVERAAGEAERAAAAASPSAAAGEGISAPAEIPLTNVRRTVARRLSEAWQVPAFQLTVSAEMTGANALLERVRELDPDVRVTVTDLLAKVCARALVRHPDLNVQFAGERLLRFPSANVGIAVAAPQGLVVPVIQGAERLSLAELARRRAELVELARGARLQLSDLEGGTFTISNLGMLGVEQFSAVLNPPQAAILAVGATIDRPVARDGEVVVRPILTVTLTVDHRAVDGAPAAEFLRTVKTMLEEPALALCSSTAVVIRRGDRLDVPFLRSLLGFAYNWHVNAFDTEISLSRYVDGWGRKGDTALIAMEEGHSVGAAWFRLFPETLQGYAFLDAETPEMTVVVVPTRQGAGIGQLLVAALLERARAGGYPALSASARRDSLDEELLVEEGFERVREEGETLTLLREL